MVSKDIPSFVLNAVGDIPKEWSLQSMPEVVYFQEGPGLRNWQYRESGTPFLNIRCIKEDGSIDLDSVQYISDEEAEQKYQHFMLEAGDTVLSSSGTLGRMAVIREEHLPLMLNTSIIRFRSLSEDLLDNSYMRLFLLSNGFAKQFSFESQGSAQVNFGPTHLKKMFMPIPPLAEQRKIAAILTSVDDAIAATQRTIDQTEVVKRGLMQQLLTEGIGHTSFKQTEIGDIPDGWYVKVDFIKIRSGFGFKLEEYSDAGIPLIRINNVSYGELHYDDLCFLPEEYLESYKEIVLREGDILLALNRPVTQGRLKIARVEESHTPAILYQRVGKLEMDSTFYDPTFYFHYLQSDLFVKRLMETFVGSDQPFIRTSEFSKIPFVVPPLEEQKRLATIFEQQERLVRTENKNLRALRRLKNGLMQVLLTGKVRVNVDEPSEVSV